MEKHNRLNLFFNHIENDIPQYWFTPFIKGGRARLRARGDFSMRGTRFISQTFISSSYLRKIPLSAKTADRYPPLRKGEISRFQYLIALPINNLPVLIHHIIIFDYMLSAIKMKSFNFGLRRLNG